MEEDNEENLRFKFVSDIDQQPGNLTIFQKVHHIVVTAESSRGHLSSREKYKILASHFRSQSLRFRVSVVSTKTLGTRLPLVSARGPLFRRAGTTS